MSWDCALNFDQWKAFSKNYKPMRVLLLLVYKFTENYYSLRLFSQFIQGILRPIFYIDINTNIDRKWKIMQNLFKKLFFQKFQVFIDLFYRYDYPRYFIYPDCMWRHMCATCNSLIFTFILHNTWNKRSSHQRCFIKKVFLEISQNSQENTCLRVSFLMKLQGCGLQLY